MFKFSFDVDESDGEAQVQTPTVATTSTRPPGPSKDHTLAELITTLPEFISYSPLPHPAGGAPLLRRDLYDARFQLALVGDGEQKAGEERGEEAEYVDADTDLIPGTYEGGLKSWEGGVDLVEVISRSVASSSTKEEEGVAAWVRGNKVLELGCGTGLPSAYLLRALLASSTPSAGEVTVLHVQDYNLPVLSLVTLPNLVLAALPSLPLSAQLAASAAAPEPAPQDPNSIAEEDEDAEEGEGEWEDDEEPKRPFDPSCAGTLELTPALLDAFVDVLKEKRVELKFTSGDWGGMATSLEGGYSLLMSAETIYAEESVAPLLEAIRAATAGAERGVKEQEQEERLEDSLGNLKVDDLGSLDKGPVILIAAKVLYFGVGGGLDSFLEQVRALGGWSTRVRDWVKGVGRAVVRIGW